MKIFKPFVLFLPLLASPAVLADESEPTEVMVDALSGSDAQASMPSLDNIQNLDEMKKEIEEGEKMLAETQAELESLRNQLEEGKQERSIHELEVERLMQEIEGLQ